MNKIELREWFDGIIRLQDRAYDWAGVPQDENYRAAEAVLKLLDENEALRKALEEMAELNYNLAHQPSNVLGRVITERDELKRQVRELEKENNAYAFRHGHNLPG